MIEGIFRMLFDGILFFDFLDVENILIPVTIYHLPLSVETEVGICFANHIAVLIVKERFCICGILDALGSRDHDFCILAISKRNLLIEEQVSVLMDAI